MGKSFLRSLWWTAFNAAFGLAPILLILILRAFLSKTSSLCKHLSNEFLLDKVLNEGIVMFVCCGLIGAATIEYFLSEVTFHKYYTGIMSITCLGALGLVGLVFLGLFLKTDVQFDHETLRSFQNVLMIFAAGFCLIVKSLLYNNES